MKTKVFVLCICLSLFLPLLPGSALGAGESVTVLIPSLPWLESMETAKQDKGRPKGRAGAKTSAPEADILISMMNPYAHSGLDMDMPQALAAFIYPPAYRQAGQKPERMDLLADAEEIRYLDKKAWGVNVALEKSGLYQFIMDGRPWWDAEHNLYRQQQVKVILPVAASEGWNEPSGQSFEILPLTRPFGLVAPTLFSGRVLVDGKPAPDMPVSMGRINSPRIDAQSKWHRLLQGRTDSSGQFSFLLNSPGWWFCEAEMEGAPLKGPDGEMKPVARSAIFWLYVNSSPVAEKSKR